MRERGIILTEGVVLGLFFVQRYRFLTIDQFARASGMHRDTASRQLRSLELRGVLSHFGNACLPGHGRTPKVYFLTRKGWELLSRESDIPAELLGSHKEVKVDSRWSPQMYHRLRTVDLMISAEVAVRSRSRLSMVATFLEYRRVRRGTRVERETADYVAKEETSDTRIIPDAAFVLENIESGKRALFFLEMDMGTERIVSQITRDKRISLFYKLIQYDRYLQGMRYRRTYAGYGDFRFFTLLFVTIGQERVENIRREMARLPPEFSDYYRLTTYSQAMGDFFSPIWNSRLFSDTRTYGGLQGRSGLTSIEGPGHRTRSAGPRSQEMLIFASADGRRHPTFGSWEPMRMRYRIGVSENLAIRHLPRKVARYDLHCWFRTPTGAPSRPLQPGSLDKVSGLW